jgi:hypothetical protein
MNRLIISLAIAATSIAHAEKVIIPMIEFLDGKQISLKADDHGRTQFQSPFVQIFNENGDKIFEGTVFLANEAGWQKISGSHALRNGISFKEQRLRLGLGAPKQNKTYIHYFAAPDRDCPPCKHLKEVFYREVINRMPAAPIIDTIELPTK